MSEFIRSKSEGKINEEKLLELEKRINDLMKKYDISEGEIEERLGNVSTSDLLESINKLISIIELERKTKLKESEEQQPKKIATAMRVTEPVKIKQQSIEEIKGIATEIKKHRLITDFDKVVNFIAEKGKAKISEISKETGINKKKVEECCKVLEKEKQIDLVYPAIGEPIARIKNYEAWLLNQKKRRNQE